MYSYMYVHVRSIAHTVVKFVTGVLGHAPKLTQIVVHIRYFCGSRKICETR